MELFLHKVNQGCLPPTAPLFARVLGLFSHLEFPEIIHNPMQVVPVDGGRVHCRIRDAKGYASICLVGLALRKPNGLDFFRFHWEWSMKQSMKPRNLDQDEAILNINKYHRNPKLCAVAIHIFGYQWSTFFQRLDDEFPSQRLSQHAAWQVLRETESQVMTLAT